MTNRQAFEKWYCMSYWNFVDCMAPKVVFDESTLGYSHYNVDLAWRAWCAAQEDTSPRTK